MKIHYFLVASFALLFLSCTSTKQEGGMLGLPGDNLNLYAVLKVFQASPTLEEFEKALNDSSNKINNLDLNGDGRIDYVRVVDSMRGNVHDILLRAESGKGEEQNVAVIVVDRQQDGAVNVQVVGDEDLYGKDYIIEPNYKKAKGESQDPVYHSEADKADSTVYVEITPQEIAGWPIVGYMYMPGYVPWYSPWYWDHYPMYWSSWTPFSWHFYYGYHYYWNYYYFGHYRRWNHYRTPGWHEAYYGSPHMRVRSETFQHRVARGEHRDTYSRPQDADRGAEHFITRFPKAPSVHNAPPRIQSNGRPDTRPHGGVNPASPAPYRGLQPGQQPRSSSKPTSAPRSSGSKPTKQGPGRHGD